MKQLNITRSRKEYIIKDLKFNYDKLNDLLYVYRENSNVYTNIVVGEFHLEFDKEGEIVGMEILKASELLSEYGILKKSLENIENVSFKVVVNNNSLLVFLGINALNEEKSATITMSDIKSPIMQVVA
ncbi:hypothetical protein CL618_02920 [archaeon]|nr:hypothetical protein [archaeon]|tara:strand:- start:8013 stop:8396 length:384 start_codon:yes stop_codon:yes gene_type:complete